VDDDTVMMVWFANVLKNLTVPSRQSD